MPSMRSKRREVLRGLGGVLIVTGTTSTAGCLGLGLANSEPPDLGKLEMQIADIRSPRVGLTSATIPVIFEVQNTSEDTEFPNPTVEYRGFVNDSEVANAREEIVSLGPGESTQQRFNLIVGYDSVGRTLVQAIENQEFIVTLEGELIVEGESREFERTYEFGNGNS